ncbi:MAG TPA: hypothetical protein VF331_16105 [Polyangiales bacterium]
MTSKNSFRRALLGCALALAGCSSHNVPKPLGDGGLLKLDGAADGSAHGGGDASGAYVFADGSVYGPGCGLSTIDAAPRSANVLLVIDESGSMTDTPTGFTVDKWSALKSALSGALSAAQNDVAFGLELFPYPIDPKKPVAVSCVSNCCEMPTAPGINVPVTAGAANVTKIVALLNASAPGGGTPTALALQRAYDYFKTGAGAALEGDNYVLLATDGGPNCNAQLSCAATGCTTNLDGACGISGGNCCDPMFGGSAAKARCLDDTATEAEIKKLSDAHIQTFVVGIPGSEAYKTSLDAFAQAGGELNPAGTPKYFAVSAAGGVAGLGSVLGVITQNVITTCRLQLSSVPPNPQELNLYLDGKLIKQAGANGWMLDMSMSPPTVVVLGTTCTTLETKGAKSVRVVYGCPTVQ